MIALWFAKAKLWIIAAALGAVAIYGYGAMQYRAGKLDEEVKWAVKLADVRAVMHRDLEEANAKILKASQEHSAYMVQSSANISALNMIVESERNEANTCSDGAKRGFSKRLSKQLNATGRAPNAR